MFDVNAMQHSTARPAPVGEDRAARNNIKTIAAAMDPNDPFPMIAQIQSQSISPYRVAMAQLGAMRGPLGFLAY